MDEEGMESSLQMYKLQLAQVESALLAAGEDNNDDLSKLRDDLKELIGLTEESLLNIKKEKLLSVLDGVAESAGTPSGASCKPTDESTTGASADDMDAEYAAFRATIAGESTDSFEHKPEFGSNMTDSSSDDSESEDTELNDIIGSKVRAPFSHSWGEQRYSNAMVISMEPLDSKDEEPKVKVLFMNPTHRSMVPCQFFLDDRCNYGEDCRYSHGHSVPVKKLKDYLEPDHGCLKLESKCLVKYTDRVWYPAVIVDIFPDHTVKVMFDRNDELLTVKMEDILPEESKHKHSDYTSSSSSESEADDVIERSSDEDEDSALPVYLWRPGQSNSGMGEWEQHTRGIASKLMARMGYIVGQGLGRHGDGRAEPVPIQLLPQGKSLDKIMELKTIAGDRDLYDVMKRRKHHQKKINEKASKSYEKGKEKDKASTSVFDFINKKLVQGKKDHRNNPASKHSHHSKGHAHSSKQITEKDLKSKSDKSLNIQLFQTLEEIKSTEREINHLKTMLERNKDRDPVVASQIKNKLASMDKYLQQLKASEGSIQRHKKTRNDNKKLTVF